MGFFEHLAAFDDSEREQERTAAAVANRRVERRFGSFVRSAVDADDREARLDLIEDELRQVVADVVSEYGGDPSKIEASLRTKFAMDPYGQQGAAPMAPPAPAEGAVATPGPGADMQSGMGSGLQTCAQGHPNCAATPGGACSQRVQEPDAPGLLGQGGGFGQPMGGQAPMSPYSAAAGEDGPIAPLFGDRAPETQHHPDPEQSFESIDQELADAPSAVGHGVLASDSTGLSDKPSPKMDKKKWKPNALGDGNLDRIDTDGGRYKTEQQDITDKAKYKNQSEEGDSFKADSPVVKHEELPSETEEAGFQTGGEDHGPHTDTWSGKGGLADPVTREKQAAGAQGPGWGVGEPGNPLGIRDGLEGLRSEQQARNPDPSDGGDFEEPCPQCGSHGVDGNRRCIGCGYAYPTQQELQQQGLPSEYDQYPQDQEDPGYMPGDLPSYGSAVKANADVDKNPLREIIESEFNGFVPQNQVQQAIAAFKKGK